MFISIFATNFLFVLSLSSGLPCSDSQEESACIAGELGSIAGSRRSPGEGNGNQLQYSCQEKLMDSGAWQVTLYGVAKSRT